MITIITASISGICCIIIRNVFQNQLETNKSEVFYISNAMIAGVIAITPCCRGIEVWQSVIIAICSSLIYHAGSRILHKFEIDDPLEMSQKYGLMSLWGIIAAGLFDRSKGYFSTGSAHQLGIQLTGAISIFSIAAAVSSIMFYILKKRRRFRTGHIYQMIGFDEV